MNFLYWSFAHLQTQSHSSSFSCKIHLLDFLPTGFCVGLASGTSVRGLATRERSGYISPLPSWFGWPVGLWLCLTGSQSPWGGLCLPPWPGYPMLLASGCPHTPLLGYQTWALSTWLQPDQFIPRSDETKPRAAQLPHPMALLLFSQSITSDSL